MPDGSNCGKGERSKSLSIGNQFFIYTGRRYTLELEKMKTKCDECGGNLTIDLVRAEGTCDVCSLVHEHITTDADTNSGSSLGEGRHNEAVNRDAAHAGARMGGRMNPFGDRFDAAGNRLSPQQQRFARRMGQLDRSSQRDTDPMYVQLISTIRTMFGKDLASAVELLARATARKLTPRQEAIRKTLTPGERRRLKCPKTSICRAGGKEHPELRGGSDQKNLEIMSLAIASIASRWFRTVSINEKQLMDTYNITRKQLVNARKVIMQHYQERVNQLWAPKPDQLNAAAAREDELDKVAQNLNDCLAKRLTEAQLHAVMEAFFGMMSHIGEPSVDASTSNVAISMIAGCVMYNVLTHLDLHHGNLNSIAKAVLRSGAGIKSRLEELNLRYQNGEFPEGQVLFGSDADIATEAANDHSEVSSKE